MPTLLRPTPTLHHAVFFAALALLPTMADAQNLLVNPDFDTNLAGWNFAPPPPGSAKQWSALDADGAADSGSGVVINNDSGLAGFASLSQCVTGIVAGETYELAGEILLPAGQGRPGRGFISADWNAGAACSTFPPLAAFGPSLVSAVGDWTATAGTFEAPPGARSVWIFLFAMKDAAGGSFRAHFDNLRFCRAGQCGASEEGWLTSSEFPDFRFRVQFTTGTGPFYGAKESDCLPDTLCVSSELPGRTAVLLRIIGPRPNGHLWFQATRFPAQQVDIEVQQLSTGIVKTYRLERLDPDDTEIPGRLDRTAFLP